VKDGIETTRKVYSLQDVPEEKINKRRLLQMRTSDKSGLREARILRNADSTIRQGILRLLNYGGTESQVWAIVNSQLAMLRRKEE